MAVDLKLVNELELIARVRKAADESIAKVREACSELRAVPAEIGALIARSLVVKAHSFLVTKPDDYRGKAKPFLTRALGSVRYQWSESPTGSYFRDRCEPPDDYDHCEGAQITPVELEEGRRYHIYTIVIAGNKD